MQYLKISNAGTVNRLFFEIIGLSTKRDKVKDKTTIGEKGSGTKLAPVAALRLGLDLTIASHDRDGPYMLSYEFEQIDVEGTPFHEIYFKYAVPDPADPKATIVKRKPSSRVMESFLGWDEPIGTDDNKAFKALREFICNAYDHDKGFRVEPSGGPKYASPGETSIYLKYTDEIKAMMNLRGRYFKFMAEGVRPYFSADDIGQIYPKSEDGKTRLFLMGVLADCSDAPLRTGLFDYSLDKKKLLSEERILVDQSQYDLELGKLLGQLNDQLLCRAILENAEAGKAPLEAHLLWYISNVSLASRAAWLEAAYAVFGTKVAVADDGKNAAAINENAKQIYGYRLVGQGHYGPRKFLRALGIPGAADLVKFGEVEIVPFTAFDKFSQGRFLAAFRLFAINNPTAVKLPIYFFLPKDERMKKLFGFAGIGDQHLKEIWIAARSPTDLPSVRDIFETLMHEARHCRTGKGDIERAFVDQADHEISEIAFREDGHIAFGDEGLVPPRGNARVKPVFGPVESRRQELLKSGISEIPEYKRK